MFLVSFFFSYIRTYIHTYIHTDCNRNKKAVGAAAAAAVETKKHTRTKSPTEKKQSVSISFFLKKLTREEEGRVKKNRRCIVYIGCNVQKEERLNIVVNGRKPAVAAVWIHDTRWQSRIIYCERRRSEKDR